MELEMRVMDQFVNEEGSDQERMCWRKIRSAMCGADSNAVLDEVIAKIEDQSSDLGESYITIDKDRLRDVLGNYFV